jgi:hypothetical protein
MNYAKETNKLLFAMNEKGQRAVYEFIMLLNSWKQEKGEDRNTTHTIKSKDFRPYEQNDTMRMIGKQNILRYADNEEARTGLRNIAQARGIDFSGKNFDVLLDTFMYGRIIGIKEERAKKKSHQPNDQVRKAAF